MRITALDLGVVTGLAYEEATAARPFIESWNLHDKDGHQRYCKLMSSLSEHLRAFKPDVVYVEAAPNLEGMRQRGTTISTLQTLYGYEAIVRCVVGLRGMTIQTVDVQRARLSFLGRKPNRGKGKEAVFARCQSLGWHGENHNETDAACIWSWAVGMESPAAQIRRRLAAPPAVR